MQPPPVLLCHAILWLGMAGSGLAGGVKDRLKTELKQAHPYAPPRPVAEGNGTLDESVLHLDPVIVTRPVFRVEDLFAEARRKAAAEKAAKFSPVTGGLIYAKNLGGKELNLGIWPRLVPTNETPVRKGEVMLRVDLLRLKW